MSDLKMRTLTGDSIAIPRAAVDALAAGLRGPLLTPDSPGYDEARTIWNAMIDRRPGLIAQCAGAADVRAAVRFAAEHGLLTSVMGAGHNIGGNAVSDGGLMIALNRMKSVRVDPKARRAWVEPGVTLGEFVSETQAFGLVAPVGINSTTGVAGLTLGGGFGWLGRKLGLTIDNLVAADVVLASGELVRASATDHPDLFWGIRGGGGNFGVVTSFEFQLHPVGPVVLAGMIVHPFSAAREVLRHYRDFTKSAPDDLTVWVVMRKAPPLPFLPESVHGTNIVVVIPVYAGAPAEGEKILAPLRAFGQPLADVVGPMPYAAWQAAFDPLMGSGMRNYWKSHDFLDLPDGLLDVLIEQVGRLPSPHSEAFIGHMGGAAGRVPPDATAYRHRDAQYVLNVHGRWETPAEDAGAIAWARGFFDAATPFATGGVYVNFMTEEERARVKDAYGPSWDRLVQLKNRYDPRNLFRLNQNIPPTAAD